MQLVASNMETSSASMEARSSVELKTNFSEIFSVFIIRVDVIGPHIDPDYGYGRDL
jgi:hypothetical protein